MSVASTPVYTSSATEKGYVAHFVTDRPTFTRIPRTVILLPEVCTLLSESPETEVETKFHDLEGGYIESNFGDANEELLSAVKVVIDHAIEPIYPSLLEVRARSTPNGVIVIAYLQEDVDIYELCDKMAVAIYDDVATVSVGYARMPSMSFEEHQEWRGYQAFD